MATEPVKAPPAEGDPTIGRLVADASRDISTLVSQEIKLAKSELKVSVTAGGIGVAMFAAAAFVAVLAIIMLSVSLAYFIHWNDKGLELHWAFLIIFGLYLAIAGLLVFVGITKVKQVKAPEKAIKQGKQIPAALKGKVE